jgi:hypothetical protein
MSNQALLPSICVCAYATPGPYQNELAVMWQSFRGTFQVTNIGGGSLDMELKKFATPEGQILYMVDEIAVPPPYADDGPQRWMWATSHKPTFLLTLLRNDNVALMADWLMYVDADARFCGPEMRKLHWRPVMERISIRTSTPFLMAGHIFSHPRKGLELLSGTLLLRRCPETIAIVEAWERSCQANPAVWDQKHLENVIQNAGPVKFLNLPPEWCWIDGGRQPDLSEQSYGKREPFIQHTQASRRHKRT